MDQQRAGGVRAYDEEKDMIQDIAPDFLDNQFREQKPERDDTVFFFCENKVLILRGKEEIHFPQYGETEELCREKRIEVPQFVYLFSIGKERFFLAIWAASFCSLAEELFCDYEYIKMFDLRRRKPKDKVFEASTAWHLHLWYQGNRFCGKCGRQLGHDHKLRMLRCEDCGNMVFPVIAPAVIVGVFDGNRLLVTKYAGREYKKYALIAGFCEIGESAEETVRREVFEETGLCVKNIQYYKSQPWGFDKNLLLGFYCELDGDDKISMDEEELALAQWIDVSEVPIYHEGLSLTEEMMNHFVEMRRNEREHGENNSYYGF